MKSNSIVYSTIALPILLSVGAIHAKERKTNIIYILADDIGYGDIGCYGQQYIETPNIDKLATMGMRFTQHYSGSAVSAPSRCSLMTGLHTGHAYIRGNDEMPERGNVWDYKAVLADSTLEGQRPLPVGTSTIASLVKDAGYTTACIGTWCLGYPGSTSTPEKMGFDFFYGYHCQRQAHDYYPAFLYRNNHREYLPNRLISPNEKLDENSDPYLQSSYEKFVSEKYAPELMFQEVTSFIDKKKDEPFFLYWATPIAHVPLQAPKKWIDHYVKKFGDESPYLGDKGYFPCRYPHAAYAAMISYMDEQIGEMVQQLKDLGIYENTLIIFTSDDGPTYNGGVDAPWFNSACPFRSEKGWGKSSLREGGIRVPMVACCPDLIRSGQVNDHVSAFWDVLPTICDIVGCSPSETDGISFLPSLIGKKQQEHIYLYWELPEGSGSRALRLGQWKGFIPDVKKGNNHIELYDLTNDLEERNDVSAFYPDIVNLIRQYMKEAHVAPLIDNFKM